MAEGCPRSGQSYRGAPLRAFTLVELLVVIGIIAVLISILLPTLGAARRQAQTASCLSSLRQWGAFFQLYANENQGWWPMARHMYVPDGQPDSVAGRTREKRWHDFLGKYANNGRLVNWDGSNLASPANNLNAPNSLGTVQDTVASLRGTNNLIRGCPSYDPINGVNNSTVQAFPNFTYGNPAASTAAVFVGYSMNIYPFAPDPITAGVPLPPPPGRNVNWVVRTGGASVSDTSAAAWGWYFKQSQWKRGSERALLMDSMHPNTSVTAVHPWWTAFSGWTTQPPVPDAISFTIDFNRHGRARTGAKYTEKSLNMLFVDGHAATVSTKEAHQAVRFTVPQ